MDPVSIVLIYFQSLTLAHLDASLHALARNDLSGLTEIVILDNNTPDPVAQIEAVMARQSWPVPIRLVSLKHGDSTKTHAWSTNTAVRALSTPWVLLSRADYLLSPDAVRLFLEQRHTPQFVVGRYWDVPVFLEQVENTNWRAEGPSVLQRWGKEYDHTLIDAGLWMTTRDLFESVGGVDESLTAWGHPQTHFQYKLHQVGVPSYRIPSIVFYHIFHGSVTPRNHGLAKQQVETLGVTIPEMWARYTGADNPYV
jgi:hypothetical protein